MSLRLGVGGPRRTSTNSVKIGGVAVPLGWLTVDLEGWIVDNGSRDGGRLSCGMGACRERRRARAALPVIAARAPHFDKWQVRVGRMFPVAVLTHRPSPQAGEPA